MKSIFLFLLLPVIVNAQIIEGISLLGLNQFPHTTIKMSGTGSRGFDDAEGTYNPKFNLNDSIITVSVSGLINSEVSTNFVYGKDATQFFKNKMIFLPNANLRLTFGEHNHIQLSINYFSDILSSFQFTDESGTTSLHFSTENGVYQVMVSKDEASFYGLSRILQSTFSFLFATQSSLSVGAMTTGFEQVYHWAPLDPFKYTTNLFDNVQFIMSLNHKFNDQSRGYVVFKSQHSLIEMEKNAYYNGEEVLTSDPYLSLLGNIGYGFQYLLFNRFGLSAEISHQFLEVNEEKKIDDITYKIEHHIWNNEILLGLNAKIFEFLNAGVLLSKYFKYDNNIYYRRTSGYDPFVYTDVGPSGPLSIIAGIDYSLSNFKVSLSFQHSQVEYDFGSEDQESLNLKQDYGNFFKLSLSAGF